MVRAHLKGLLEEHKRKWGARALIPEHVSPLSQPQLLAINDLLRQDTVAFTLRWKEARKRPVS